MWAVPGQLIRPRDVSHPGHHAPRGDFRGTGFRSCRPNDRIGIDRNPVPRQKITASPREEFHLAERDVYGVNPSLTLQAQKDAKPAPTRSR